MDVQAEMSPAEAPRRYVEKMRRHCAWYRRGGALLVLAAVPLFAASPRGAHIGALVALLVGGSAIFGGFYWGLTLRGAQQLLAGEPREMLMDRWVTPGPKVGAWKTKLHTPAGESAMLGSYQLGSFRWKRVRDASCLVYGPSRPGGLVVVSMGDYTLIGSAESPQARGSLTA